MSQEVSETTYRSLVGDERPDWAIPGEGVYQMVTGIAAGRVIAVKMVQTARDLDSDGIEDTYHAETVGRMVDLETGETIKVGNRPIVTEVWNNSQSFGGKDGSDVSLAEWVVKCHEACIFRAIRREQAAIQIESISGLIVRTQPDVEQVEA